MAMHIEGLRNYFVTENWLQLEPWKLTPRHQRLSICLQKSNNKFLNIINELLEPLTNYTQLASHTLVKVKRYTGCS